MTSLLEESQESLEMMLWQQWVIQVLQELHEASGTFSWKGFFENLALCMRQRGSGSKLAQITGFSRDLFYIWLGRKHTQGNRILFSRLHLA